ncbi:MAG: phosphoribosylformylglycinamidine synthase [Chitinispirillia bacterium]|nr:phosphoribosylformylglycinamidine synthase [Chitinispirillia bacterium]
MSKVRRLFVEKRDGYDVYANKLFLDFKENLGISGLSGVRTINRYDIESLSDEHYQSAKNIVFADLSVDNVYDESIALGDGDRVFAVEYLPGQYDQKEDNAAQCVSLLTLAERPAVAAALVIVLKGNISDDEFAKVKRCVINPVDSREASFHKPDTLHISVDTPADVAILSGLITMSEDGLEKMRNSLGLAMKSEDLLFCQQYFRDTEKRDPTITEIRMLDTYWSDHCRHTTFLTSINNIEIEEAPLNTPVKTALKTYEDTRKFVYGDNHKKDITLMNIAQMGMKELRKKGLLNDLDESEEINACSIVVPAVIDGKTEEWLVMFKNETHNHPTEIEPFGGASTCLGGGIRDPLSGRSYVYQAMRITGCGDPRTPVEKTLPGKLPQSKITTIAARGYSSYGNQIGVASGFLSEIYHDGYVAKRMELGALVAAAPKSNVVRGVPESGDIVVLVGGRTGRDGCGGATGSSKEQTEESITVCSAEVQKGNAAIERRIIRLFRDPKISRMIKRCNDFGAGGVSVAIGELAPGLDINLDAVPAKYAGLDGTELAISESQERMAVVIAKSDLKSFEDAANSENLETAVVASVTDTRRLHMKWRGKTIVDISRDFLDTNGISQNTEVKVNAPSKNDNFFAKTLSAKWKNGDLSGAFTETLSDINICGKRGLAEMFDSSVGAATVLMPLGGKYQSTPAELMVAKLPVLNGETSTGTAMSYGYDPNLSSWSPFHGALYAVVHSVAKVVASGGDHTKIRLTFQEFFERLGNDKARWGKPFAALLGAYLAQTKLSTAALGGKDSMSGTFKDINVPPTLVSFAIAPVDVSKTISPEFKKSGNAVYLVSIPRDEFEMPDFDVLNKSYSAVTAAISKGDIVSAHTVGLGGLAEAVSKMCFGNRIGFSFDDGIKASQIFTPDYGNLVIEINGNSDNVKNIFGDDANIELLGFTTDKKEINVCGSKIDLEQLYAAWEKPLVKVFPIDAPQPACSTEIKDVAKNPTKTISPYKGVKIAKPRVLIPVFPGTCCEYDCSNIFNKAGAQSDFFILKNMKLGDMEKSVKEMADKIANAQIIMFPGGFSAGDEPDGAGKFIPAFMHHQRIKDAIAEFLSKRDGLMLGISNGFQTLINLGLVPYGEIRNAEKNSPTLTFNTIGRHISRIAYTKVCSTNSPWLSNVKIGDVHAIPISHGEGRFVASKEQLDALTESGQIATRYVNCDGEYENTINGNSNGSCGAVEGILSPDGRIFGKMGHSERIGKWVAKNIYGESDQKIFESGVKYFS